MKIPILSRLWGRKNPIYMDYAAFAPMVPEARRAFTRAARISANPSSIHKPGLLASEELENAREKIANVLSAHSDEIIFVGSGTESDALAIMGVFKHARLSTEFAGKNIHIITTVIEHPAVLEACRHLEKMGAQVTYLGVLPDGRIDLKEFKKALRPETILVSISYANNEIGTIQPVRDIAKEIRHYKKETKSLEYPLFHIDACQTAQYENINVEQIGADLLTVNGTKLGGPSGIAFLYVRRGTPIEPILYGGGQEHGLRSGTENVPGAAAVAAALHSAQKIREKESKRLSKLRDHFLEEAEKRIPELRVNGSKKFRLPNNVHISIPNIKSELLVIELDAKGIAASAGSACSSAKDSGSHVLAGLYGESDEKKWGSVRFSFGRKTSEREIETTLSALEYIVNKYKEWQ